MATKIKALYVYSQTSGVVTSFVNAVWKTDKGIRKAYIPTSKIFLNVSLKAGQVLEDPNRKELYVWLNTIDKQKAIKAFSNYILDHIGSDIRTSAVFVSRVKGDYAKAQKKDVKNA